MELSKEIDYTTAASPQTANLTDGVNTVIWSYVGGATLTLSFSNALVGQMVCVVNQNTSGNISLSGTLGSSTVSSSTMALLRYNGSTFYRVT